MSKQSKILSAMAVLLMLFAGCAEETIDVSTVKKTIGEQITIHAETPDDDTKTRLAYDDDNLKLTWEAGDQLLVVGLDDVGNYKGQSTFTYTGTPGNTSGPFTGPAIDEAVKYKIYYPSTVTVNEETGAITYPSMDDQKQEADSSTTHLRKFIVLENTEVLDLTTAFQLKMVSSILKFDLTNVPVQVGTLEKLEWKVETANGMKSVSMNFAPEAITFNASKNSLTAYMSFLPEEIPHLKAGGTFTVVLEGDRTFKSERTSTAGKTYTAGQRYTAEIDGEWIEEVRPFEAGDVIVYDQQGNLQNYYSCAADDIRSDTIINKALAEVVQLGGGTVYLKGPFTFLIGNTVTIGDNTHLKGDADVKIQPHDGANWEAFIPLIGNMSISNQNIEISGFQLYGNEPGVTTPPMKDRYYLCIVLNGNNISIHDMHLSGNYGDGIKIGHDNRVPSNNNIRIYNNTIFRIQHDAVYVIRGQDVRIYNNHITSRLNSGIRIYNTNNVEIHDNYVTSNNEGGAGIQVQKFGNISMDQVYVYNNEIYKPATHGIWIFGNGNYRNSNASVHVHHNKIYSTGRHGIASNGFNATVENNVIDGSRYSGIIQATLYDTPPIADAFTLTAKNNIISNNGHHGVRNDLADTHSFSIAYNCFFNNAQGNAYEMEIPANNIIADPQFADRTNHDFHLKSQYGRWNGTAWVIDGVTSPCIDAGDPADAYSNEPSPNGSRINIGLYGNTAEASKSAN